MRGRLASAGKAQAAYVLLAVVHIPQDDYSVRADTAFSVRALGRIGMPEREDCKRYLEFVADDLRARKEGQRKGDVTRFSIAGLDFIVKTSNIPTVPTTVHYSARL